MTLHNHSDQSLNTAQNLRRLLRWFLIIALIGFAIFIKTRTPSNAGEWSILQAELPRVQIATQNGRPVYHVDYIRDFRYSADGSVATRQYRSAQFSAADLQRIWLGISHFGGNGLAHIFLSFEFSEQQFLVASVEARLHPEQRYNPIFGLFRQYMKMIVLGTEQDVIGLRTHIRDEKVLLYPLQLNPAQQQFVFESIMEDAQALSHKAAFYNTVLDNCATNLLKYDPDYHVYTSLFDYRLLLPGFSDEVAQEKGWIDNSRSLLEMRPKATIDAKHIELDSENFSQLIREPWLQH